MSQVHVLFVGDSNISRFQAASSTHPDIPNNLNLQQCKINFLSRRGAKIATIKQLIPRIRHLKPDIVFLQVGVNDIQAQNSSGSHVATQLDSLVSLILKIPQCNTVYLGELIFRFKGRYISTEQEAELYNNEVHQANCQLKAQFANNEHTVWWACKGVKNAKSLVMHSDGVHLSQQAGMFKYYKSLRGAVLHAVNRL